MAKKKRRRKTASPTGNNTATTNKPAVNRGPDATLNKLAFARAVRRREPGDGLGADIGILSGGIISLEARLLSVPESTRARLLAHTREKYDELIRPYVKLLKQRGASEYEIRLLTDVGANSIRSIMEFLEDKTSEPGA